MNDVRFVDRGWEAILKRVNDLAHTCVKVGAIGPDAKRVHPHRAGSSWAVTIAEALLINEYGTGAGAKTYVPARSPLRRTFTPTNAAIQSMGARAARMVVESAASAATAMAFMGKVGVDALRSTLAGQNPPSNAARTIKRKGFDHPLIWTGMLWESIASAVERRLSGTDKDDGGAIQLGGDY